MYYDKEGNKITLEKFYDLFQNKDYQIIQQDIIYEYFVSTVWIGVHPSFEKENKKIFETVIFKNLNGNKGKSIFQKRYCSLDEAKKMHLFILNAMNFVVPLIEGITMINDPDEELMKK